MINNIPLSQEQQQLILGSLLGDGYCNRNRQFIRFYHCGKQREYLEWKVKLLDKFQIKNNGIKEYISTCGYNIGKGVLYSQMSVIPTIKALRRTVYIPKKTITRKLLNWLTPLEIAIWYMDDGHINVNTSKQRSSIQHTIKIATCVDESTVEVIIQYFLDIWNIKFRKFPEGKNTFSIASSSEEDYSKFVNLIKPFVEQVPSMLYKIRDNFTKKEFLDQQKVDSEARDS